MRCESAALRPGAPCPNAPCSGRLYDTRRPTSPSRSQNTRPGCRSIGSRVQASFGVPLPESAQWERVEALADAVHPVFLRLQRPAARGDVLAVDDTGVKILSCVRENRTRAKGERTGTHTTGIVSPVDGRRIAIYRSSRRHAGENVVALPAERPLALAPPVQIGDALARNRSHAFEVVVAKCLAHARRQFVDVEASFPAECGRVPDAFAAVYRADAKPRG